MKCKICGKNVQNLFKKIIIKKYEIQYFHCENCDFIFTEEPFWLDEVYDSSAILEDTGIMWRNNELAKDLSIMLYSIFDKNAKYLDYAGGLGILVRLMRDIGFDFYWDDLYAKNILAQGFEYNKTDKIEAITTFESFEHFENPIKEIEKMLSISRNIIFSTELQPRKAPKPDEWWYYLFDSGKHIGLFSKQTLEFISKKYNLKFYSFGWVHIFTEKNISKKDLKFIKFVYKLNKDSFIRDFIFKKIKKKMKPRFHDDMKFILSKQ